ncbi:PD-(D/E)XK nuclease family protein [Canibacter zhoujuaniae]|uniref:PD-(D/E)XK nuclease family protein n=1 Tax=Canibacter zhoujuaniae TaxID=2708343 RepID=UPI00142269DE|nr:PD-(D/E)XK nuclease family protein [Canibacter zhoujuaniae]
MRNHKAVHLALEADTPVLSPRQNVLISGAAGTGKSSFLWRSVAAVTQHSVAFLSPSRQAAVVHLNNYRAGKYFADSVRPSDIRAVNSLAFHVLASDAARLDATPPRLLNAGEQENLLRLVLEAQISAADAVHPLAVLRESALLYSQLRDFWGIVETYGADAVREVCKQRIDSKIWESCHTVIAEAQRRAANDNAYTAESLVNAAAGVLQQNSSEIPELMIVDNAEQLTIPMVRFLLACVRAGKRLWLAGDEAAETTPANGITAKALLLFREALPQIPGVEYREIVCDRGQHRQSVEVGEFISNLFLPLAELRKTASEKHDVYAAPDYPIKSFLSDSSSELFDSLALDLRQRRVLAAEGQNVAWEEMLVVCRDREHVDRTVAALNLRRVPAHSTGGGVVLSEISASRHLLEMMLLCYSGRSASWAEAAEWLRGPLFNLRESEIRKIRSAMLVAGCAAKGSASKPAVTAVLEELLARASAGADDTAIPDAIEPQFRKLLTTLSRARHATEQGTASPSQVFWAVWDSLNLADKLQTQAIEGGHLEKMHANQILDAVVALQNVITRYEEQSQTKDPAAFVAELLFSDVPQDVLSTAQHRKGVRVATPHAVIGTEFKHVALLGLQEGLWPNLRLRGSLLELPQLLDRLEAQRWGTPAETDPTVLRALRRNQLFAEELALLYLAASRASCSIAAFGLDNEAEPLSVFWSFFAPYLAVGKELGSDSLEGQVAFLRSRLELNPSDTVAASQLAALAANGVVAARPENWFGLREKLESDPLYATQEALRLSPSKLQTAAECAVNAVVRDLTGDKQGNKFAAHRGMLVHEIAELIVAGETNLEKLKNFIDRAWEAVGADAAHPESELLITKQMAENLLKHSSDWEGDETKAEAELSGVVNLDLDGESAAVLLQGRADLLQQATGAGEPMQRVIDIKTSRSATEIARAKLQLEAYLYLLLTQGAPPAGEYAAGILQPHPYAEKNNFQKVSDANLASSEAFIKQFEDTVRDIIANLKGSTFLAEPASHCSRHLPGGFAHACAEMVVPPVSFQAKENDLDR